MIIQRETSSRNHFWCFFTFFWPGQKVFFIKSSGIFVFSSAEQKKPWPTMTDVNSCLVIYHKSFFLLVLVPLFTKFLLLLLLLLLLLRLLLVNLNHSSYYASQQHCATKKYVWKIILLWQIARLTNKLVIKTSKSPDADFKLFWSHVFDDWSSLIFFLLSKYFPLLLWFAQVKWLFIGTALRKSLRGEVGAA